MKGAAVGARKSDAQLELTVRKSDGPPAVDDLKREIDQEIGRKVKASRYREGRTFSYRHIHNSQEDIAQVLGLHRAAISEIEAGRRRLTAAELVLLAEYLKVPVTDLLP
jgi:DNA-binding XRE family transcriptional regulator